MNRIYLIIYIIASSTIIILNSGYANPDEPQSKITAEIETLKKEIQLCEQYEESILATIDKLALQIKLKEKEIQVYNIKIKELEKNINEINTSIAKLESNIAESEEKIKRRIVASYKMGTLGYYKLLLYPENTNMLIKCYQFISIISKKDISLMKEYEKNKSELLEKLATLKIKQNEMLNLKQGIEATKFELTKIIKEKNLLLENIQSQKELYSRAINELNISSKKIENLIVDFEHSIDYFDFLPDINKFKGILNWPLKGKIIKLFGKIRHEKFNTYTFNKGIEIATKEGTEVKTIFDGKVVFADWFQGYGKTVIIEHKGRVFSIYAHNSAITVKVGDIVHSGDIIAYSGSTGSLEGESLYFEIREGRQPVNPLTWLQKLNKAEISTALSNNK
jgi:septal ring factor EnvC (AmiA/AmiB activator)